MSIPRAVLAFPLRPAAATAALAGRWRALAFVLVPPLAGTGFLFAKGCQAGDAAAGGLAVLGLILGLGVGGALLSLVGARILGTGVGASARVVPCLVCAAWTTVLFTAVLGGAKLFGVGPEAVLLAGLVVLVWGAIAGIGLLSGDEDAGEGGRALVASCAGVAGAVAGLWIALMLVYAQLGFTLPAPADADAFARGDVLLVRRTDADPAPGEIAVLLGAGGTQAVLARIDAHGDPQPIGEVAPEWRDTKWIHAGRVFFHFGKRGIAAVGDR